MLANLLLLSSRAAEGEETARERERRKEERVAFVARSGGRQRRRLRALVCMCGVCMYEYVWIFATSIQVSGLRMCFAPRGRTGPSPHQEGEGVLHLLLFLRRAELLL